MSVLPRPYLTPEEYLEIERRAEIKSEYFEGEMFAMAGASEDHNAITGNLYLALRTALAGRPCRSYINDMRVRVEATGLYTYPDLVVVCGERLFADDRKDTLRNPTVLFEVLSPSTEAYDRGRKFHHYRTIESLLEYVLVAQDRLSVEKFTRQENGLWLLSEVDDPQGKLSLESVDTSLKLSDIYAEVTLWET